MDGITVCSTCHKRGGYEGFTDIVPLSQCAVCGKKCLGFLVNETSRAMASPEPELQPNGGLSPLRKLDKVVLRLHV
jgi:hypothetical protein